MSKHAKDKKHNLLLIFLIILVLIVLGIITYIFISIIKESFLISPNTLNTETIDNFNIIIDETSELNKIFDDAPHLYCDEFILTEENGISTVNGKIYNSSDSIVNNLSCIYTLKNINNDIIYEFTVFAEQIQPQSSFGFTSVVLLDLSNVVDYSVKLYNNT